MADPALFPTRPLDFPIADGPFKPSWNNIGSQYPDSGLDWLRDAKFGIWVHFGPQSAGRSGDWYARRLYEQTGPNDAYYRNHLRDYGHPSRSGYKDVLRTWNPQNYDPDRLARSYAAIGARFVLVQGVHHDNFDNWNSAYQPWNSCRLGPKRDFLEEWRRAARRYNLRFGVTFHHDYSWWWFQTAFGSDETGPLAGIPYDGHLRLSDGKGTWWEGLDPQLLYTTDLREYQNIYQSPKGAGIFHRHQKYAEWYATRWALRIVDVIEKYDPDFIYTDGNAVQPFSGHKTGLGAKFDATERVVAHLFNRSLQRRGKVDTFALVKFHPPVRGLATTQESGVRGGIKTDQPWFGEAPLGEWFWEPGIVYDAPTIVFYLIENAARDGGSAICTPFLEDGSLEDECWNALDRVGRWLKINGEGYYSSHAWSVLGEGAVENGSLKVLPRGGLGKAQSNVRFDHNDLRFTQGQDGSIYVWTLSLPQPGHTIFVKSLGKNKFPGRRINKIILLGSTNAVEFSHDLECLNITVPENNMDISLCFKVFL